MKKARFLIFMLLLILLAFGCLGETESFESDHEAVEHMESIDIVPPSETLFTVTELQLFPPEQVFDADFEAFYKEFVAAVHNRDIQFIDSILDEMVHSSFGGEPGKAFFHEFWEAQSNYFERDLWTVLEEIIALGGVFYQENELFSGHGKRFVAPFTFALFDLSDLQEKNGMDAFNSFVVIDRHVNVYREKSIESEVIDVLNYNILEFHNNMEFWSKGSDDFVGVMALSGEVGYIQVKHIRSPVDYRFAIEWKDDGWKLIFLTAGD